MTTLNPSQLFNSRTPTPIRSLQDTLCGRYGVDVMVKREDLNHPDIQGNKWHKLKHHLIAAYEQGFRKIISCGGAYSNHLYSLASACRLIGFEAEFIMRGDAFTPENPTVTHILESGARIRWVDRETFRKARDEDGLSSFVHHEDVWVIPEGGGGAEALTGCGEWMREIVSQMKETPTHILLPVGTGTTAVGLLRHCPFPTHFHLIAAAADQSLGARIERGIKGKLQTGVHWDLKMSFHFGGFAKWNAGLIQFMRRFEEEHGFFLDPVYTAKAFYALYSMIRDGEIQNGARVLMIHTGGLQGRKGFFERFKDRLPD